MVVFKTTPRRPKHVGIRTYIS